MHKLKFECDACGRGVDVSRAHFIPNFYGREGLFCAACYIPQRDAVLYSLTVAMLVTLSALSIFVVVYLGLGG